MLRFQPHIKIHVANVRILNDIHSLYSNDSYMSVQNDKCTYVLYRFEKNKGSLHENHVYRLNVERMTYLSLNSLQILLKSPIFPFNIAVKLQVIFL